MENHLLLHFYVKLVVQGCQHFTVDAFDLLYYQTIATKVSWSGYMAAACIGKGQKGRSLCQLRGCGYLDFDAAVSLIYKGQMAFAAWIIGHMGAAYYH